MNRLILAVVVLSVVSGILAQSVLLLHYELNKDYYSQVLCINKEKPLLHCEGKCQLKKELQQQEKNDQSPAVPLKTKPDFQPLWMQTTGVKLCVSENNFEQLTYYGFSHSAVYVIDVFHPPLG